MGTILKYAIAGVVGYVFGRAVEHGCNVLYDKICKKSAQMILTQSNTIAIPIQNPKGGMMAPIQ